MSKKLRYLRGQNSTPLTKSIDLFNDVCWASLRSDISLPETYRSFKEKKIAKGLEKKDANIDSKFLF